MIAPFPDDRFGPTRLAEMLIRRFGYAEAVERATVLLEKTSPDLRQHRFFASLVEALTRSTAV
jgi:hypothetical protein